MDQYQRRKQEHACAGRPKLRNCYALCRRQMVEQVYPRMRLELDGVDVVECARDEVLKREAALGLHLADHWGLMLAFESEATS